MSLYKRPNSRYWWAKIRLPDGGCVCRSSGTAKRQEAQEWLDRTRADLWRVHRLGERPTYTWQDAVVRWSEEKADKATALEDRVKFQWLDGYVGDRLLHTITRDDVQAIGAAKARETSRARQTQADDVVFTQRLGGGEHQLVALPVVEHQRQRLGLRQALQATEHDAKDLGSSRVEVRVPINWLIVRSSRSSCSRLRSGPPAVILLSRRYHR